MPTPKPTFPLVLISAGLAPLPAPTVCCGIDAAALNLNVETVELGAPAPPETVLALGWSDGKVLDEIDICNVTAAAVESIEPIAALSKGTTAAEKALDIACTVGSAF